MDKIQELHHDKVKCLTGIIKTDVLASDHATITEDLIGKAMEWAGRIGFELNEGYWSSKNIKGIQIYSTSELIQLFKETL